MVKVVKVVNLVKVVKLVKLVKVVRLVKLVKVVKLVKLVKKMVRWIKLHNVCQIHSVCFKYISPGLSVCFPKSKCVFVADFFIFNG